MKALVLIVRGLHAGYVGCYGNEWLATPGLDRLAVEGVVFDQHLADQPDAAGARRAWRTGCHAFPLPEGTDGRPPGSAHDLVQLLRQHGVSTALVLDSSRPTPDGFADGWDHVQVTSQRGEGTPMERTLEAAVEMLEKLAGKEHWLLWVELATLLTPWALPDSFRIKYFQEFADDEEEEDDEDEGEDGEDDQEDNEYVEEELLEPLVDLPPGPLPEPADETFQRLQHTYAGAVAYVDAGLDLLLEELRRRGLLDDFLVVVTSDHGLPLGEHGIFGLHRPWLHDELVHVPLLMRLPGAAESGRRIAALTQSVDLMPTLLEAFAVPAPPVHGSSLLPLARGEVEQVRPHACIVLQQGETVEWALRTPEWAYLLPLTADPADAPREAQLYVKPDDRWEVNDLRQKHQDLAEELERTLRAHVASS